MFRKGHLFLSLFSGLLLSLAWITGQFSWVLLFSLVPILFVYNQRRTESPASDFKFYLLTFFTWNFISCWWIAYVSIVGMLLIVFLNAILMAGIWFSANIFRRKYGNYTGYFTLIIFWLAFEFLHFNWEIQWPWMSLGNGLANSVKIIQWIEYTGVLGGSLWILVSNILIFDLLSRILLLSVSKILSKGFILLIVVSVPVLFSNLLYENFKPEGDEIEVIVLQPNIDPYFQKFAGTPLGDQIHTFNSLSGLKITKTTDLIVAPETALLPFWEDSVQLVKHLMNDLLKDFPNVAIVAGANTMKISDFDSPVCASSRQAADGRYFYQVYNSAIMFSRDSNIQIAHKNILVSGVEKIPFQDYVSFANRFILDLGGTKGSLTAGKIPRVFVSHDSLRIGPVICFESAFGDYCNQLVNKGAEVLVVMTNDGWWKDSPGVDQHFSFSRLRAIENRRSIIRSANTGISGFIDGRGEVIKQTQVNTTDAIATNVQLNKSFTFYARYGDYLGKISLILSILSLLYLLFNRNLFKNKT
jgi:apolipoprotein N-acyltransferase